MRYRRIPKDYIASAEASCILKVDHSSLMYGAWVHKPLAKDWLEGRGGFPMYRKLLCMEIAQKITDEQRNEIQEKISFNSVVEQVFIGSKNQNLYVMARQGELPFHFETVHNFMFVKRKEFLDWWDKVSGKQRLLTSTMLRSHLHWSVPKYRTALRQGLLAGVERIKMTEYASLLTLDSVNRFLYKNGFAPFNLAKFDSAKFDKYYSEIGMVGNNKEFVTVKRLESPVTEGLLNSCYQHH